MTTYLALTAFLILAAPADPVSLTPENVAEHGYHLRVIVVDDPEKIRRIREAPELEPRGPIVVRLRFGLLSKGKYAVLADDLEAIQGICLVVRDGDAIQSSTPLQVKVDPGNEVHLYTHFSTNRDLLPKTQLVFDEVRKEGKRSFVVDLKEFIKPE